MTSSVGLCSEAAWVPVIHGVFECVEKSMEKIKQFVNEHPQWTSWIVLAVGMVAILIWSARDVGLLPGQWVALIVATILVAGLAVWIIGWEDEEEFEDTSPASPDA
jgi:MFS superfamily sulfate permease-like transporter